MRIFINSFIVLSFLFGQESYNIELVSNVAIQNAGNDYGVSDVWGYTDETGIEYAIIGYQYGTYIYDVSSNPQSPILVFDILGPSGSDYYFHRDYKTFGDYLYIVNEMTGSDTGMQIIDLSPLPDSVPVKLSTYSAITQSHNLWINELGYAFIENYYPENIHIVDVNNPFFPTSVGSFYGDDGKNCHDIYTRENYAYISEGWDSRFGVYDISDISSPVHLATIPVIGYAHNAWVDESGDYLITTEETDQQTIKIWDISDLDNINLVSEYLGQNGLAHNVHVDDNFLVVSHYTSGLKIVDIFDPLRPVEVASYDTYHQNDGGGYYGCWGAYPFTSNNYIYASDMQNGLYILDFDSVRAGWVEGMLFDSNLDAVAFASLRSFLNNEIFYSESDGSFNIGHAEGTHEFEISMFGDVLDTLSIHFEPHITLEQDLYVDGTLFTAGDTNMDGLINIQDIIVLVNIILSPEAPSDLVYSIADISDDGIINIQDLIMLVNIIIEGSS